MDTQQQEKMHWFGIKLGDQWGLIIPGFRDADFEKITQHGLPPNVRAYHQGTAHIDTLKKMPVAMTVFGTNADIYPMFEHFWRSNGIKDYPKQHELNWYN